MKNGKITFTNGLTLIYVYPENGQKSIAQLHFGFDGVYGQRKDATLQDALLAMDGMRNDLQDFSRWIGENGLPDLITGSTSTNLLIRILNESGIPTSRDVEGGAASFRIETSIENIDAVLARVQEKIEGLLQRGKEVETRRQHPGNKEN